RRLRALAARVLRPGHRPGRPGAVLRGERARALGIDDAGLAAGGVAEAPSGGDRARLEIARGAALVSLRWRARWRTAIDDADVRTARAGGGLPPRAPRAGDPRRGGRAPVDRAGAPRGPAVAPDRSRGELRRRGGAPE